MTKNEEKIFKFKYTLGDESEAVLSIIGLKNRNNKTSAVSIAVTCLFKILDEKNILDTYLTNEAMELYRAGKTPSEIWILLSPHDDKKNKIKKEVPLRDNALGQEDQAHNIDNKNSETTKTPDNLLPNKKANFFDTLVVGMTHSKLDKK